MNAACLPSASLSSQEGKATGSGTGSRRPNTGRRGKWVEDERQRREKQVGPGGAGGVQLAPLLDRYIASAL